MNRRDLMKAAPAGLFLSAGAAAAETTPIMGLFREWRSIGDEIDTSENFSDEFFDSASERRLSIELKMLAIPAMDAIDVLAKLIAHTQYFNSPVDGDGGESAIAEARNLVGELA